jgi:hypothetical protein
MPSEQRLVFIFSKDDNGKLRIDMRMYPEMAKTEEEFRKLPMYIQELQSAAAAVGKFAMEKIANLYKG